MIIDTFVAGPFDANCYVIENGGETAVIDCGEYTGEIKKRLEKANVKYILLTHGHADHILGVWYLKQDHPEAKVLVHELDREYLISNRLHELDKEIITSGIFAIEYPTYDGETHFMEPDGTVADGDVLELGGTEIQVLHTPGHSAGSVCYFFPEEHTLFSGDTLFCLTVGRTDLTTSSDDDMLASITRLYKMMGIYDIYPGHNRATTMDYEKRRNRYMRRFR